MVPSRDNLVDPYYWLTFWLYVGILDQHKWHFVAEYHARWFTMALTTASSHMKRQLVDDVFRVNSIYDRAVKAARDAH